MGKLLFVKWIFVGLLTSKRKQNTAANGLFPLSNLIGFLDDYPL